VRPKREWPAGFVVPAALAGQVEADESTERGEWLSELPATVQSLVERWSLVLGEPFQPGGQTAWVTPARDAAGRDLVLKVGWAHPEAEHEADGLRAWCGAGAVRIYESCRTERTSALLLERCRPGMPLATVAEPEQDTIIAGLLTRLWHAPTRGFAGRPLREMCQAWVAEFGQRLAALPEGSGVIDPGVARAAMELFTQLPDSAQREVLLCTDLHAGNVLSAQREPWLVIDPKPFLGDPCYDVLQHLLNCTERLAADPVGMAQRMADLAGVDGQRVTQWLFARCVLECMDQPELRPVAAALAPS